MQNNHSTHTSVQESRARDLLWPGPVLKYKTDFKLPCNQTAHPYISQIGWSCHSEGFLHFQRPEMKTISEKKNKYQIRLFINTLVKLPVVYLQPLKPRFDHFARETKKETDCYPNSNADLYAQRKHCRWSMPLKTIPSPLVSLFYCQFTADNICHVWQSFQSFLFHHGYLLPSHPQLRSQQALACQAVPSRGEHTLPTRAGAEISKGDYKDSSGLDTRGHHSTRKCTHKCISQRTRWCVRFGLRKLMQSTRTLPTPNASLSPQPAHSRTAPGGLERANEFSSRQPFLWLGSSPGFPCVQCKRSARMPCRSVPRIHYRLRTDSSVVPCGVRLPPPPQLENVSAAGMTQCQVSPLRALELPPGRDWIVTGGPSRFRPADWPDRSRRSTAGSSWWPQFCQPRSPQRSEYTDPSSPCAGSGTSCLQ